MRSRARRCGYVKRPLSQSQPRSTSGWLRERMRLTFPSRIVADVLQPTGAAGADGRHVLDLPRPRLEAVEGRRERADGAELDHVPGEDRAVRLVLEGRDLGARAAVPRDQLAVLGDLLREARAAVAEDAALAVERDQRRDRDRLVERELREGHARCCRARSGRSGPGAGTRRPCRRPGSRAGG